MPDSVQRVEQTLQQLGLETPSKCPPCSQKVRQAFDAQEAHPARKIIPLTCNYSGRFGWPKIWCTDENHGRLAQAVSTRTQARCRSRTQFPNKPISKRSLGTSRLPSNRRRQNGAYARSRRSFSTRGDPAARLRHPLRRDFEEIEWIFLSAWLHQWSRGRRWKLRYYNFEALTFPSTIRRATTWTRSTCDAAWYRPAAAAHTHFANADPTMEKQQPPVRIIVPGKVYRRDNPDATHGFMFHQIEGFGRRHRITFLAISRVRSNISCANFLGPKVKTRLRPSYFPFTEPSVEIDATCVFCGGPGCNVCKQSGWMSCSARDGRSCRLWFRQL